MVFRSFSKLHPNGPVPHQISPPNSRFINRCELPGFYLPVQITRLARAPPPDTADHHFWPEPPSQKTCLFNLVGRRVSPIQAASFHLQSGDGECLPATQLYLSVFTCPTVSLDLPSDAGASSPARHPTFSTPRPARLTHPDREYFLLRSDVGESLLATQLAFLSLPVQHSES